MRRMIKDYTPEMTISFDTKLGDIQVHEEADEVRSREEVGGILLHRLLLLSRMREG